MHLVRSAGQEAIRHTCTKIYQGLYHWFDHYVKQMDSPDVHCRSRYEFKYRHTQRVVAEIEMLGGELHLSNRERLLAKAIALFHDIGRFEQYRTYATFSDHDSIDHGDLGSKIIDENILLKNFTNREQALIYHAILWHNKKNLPKGPKDDTLFFSKLIRDADKLDILRIHSKKGAGIFSDEVPQTKQLSEDVSDQIYHGLMQGKSVDYGKLENTTDLVLTRIGWVFDLNFGPTFRQYARRNYFKTFSTLLPDTPKIRKILAKTQAYLYQKCNTLN